MKPIYTNNEFVENKEDYYSFLGRTGFETVVNGSLATGIAELWCSPSDKMFYSVYDHERYSYVASPIYSLLNFIIDVHSPDFPTDVVTLTLVEACNRSLAIGLIDLIIV